MGLELCWAATARDEGDGGDGVYGVDRDDRDDGDHGMMGTSGMTADEGDGLTRATGVTGASKERYEGEGENVSIAGRTNNYKQQGKIEPLSQWTLEG